MAMFWYLRASCTCHANSCPRACGGDCFGIKVGPKREVKWVPNSSPEASWSLLATSSPPGTVLEASWGGLGGLLGALGPVLEASWSALGRVLGALEPVLEASCRVQEATRAQNVISSKSIVFFQWNSLIFEVPGSLFRGQNRYTTASHCSSTA